MDVNDDAYLLDRRGAHVGAGLPAKDVNDDACYLEERVIVDVHRRQAGSYTAIGSP
jgi:hypothetical protein